MTAGRKTGRPPKMWYAVENGWLLDPRVRRTPSDAIRLWLAGRDHCSGEGTDGFIAEEFIPLLAVTSGVDADAQAKVLVLVQLWEVVDGGFLDVDFLRANVKAELRERRWLRDRERKQADSGQ